MPVPKFDRTAFRADLLAVMLKHGIKEVVAHDEDMKMTRIGWYHIAGSDCDLVEEFLSFGQEVVNESDFTPGVGL